MGCLALGERLSLADGGETTVAEREEIFAASGCPFTVYNFEVSDWHTYFVAPPGATAVDSTVWVHNDCVGGRPANERLRNDKLVLRDDNFRVTVHGISLST